MYKVLDNIEVYDSNENKLDTVISDNTLKLDTYLPYIKVICVYDNKLNRKERRLKKG